MDKKTDKLTQKMVAAIKKNKSKDFFKLLEKGGDVTAAFNMAIEDRYYPEDWDKEVLSATIAKIQVENLSEDGLYPYLSFCLENKDTKLLNNLLTKYPNSEKLLENLASKYYSYSNKDFETLNLIYKSMKYLVEKGTAIEQGVLANVVSACTRLAVWEDVEPERMDAMQKNIDLCKLLIENGASVNERYGHRYGQETGLLAAINSPCFFECQESIDYIFDLCKLLMDNGADLYADPRVLSDNICRKDTGNILRPRLEEYYQKMKEDENERE